MKLMLNNTHRQVLEVLDDLSHCFQYGVSLVIWVENVWLVLEMLLDFLEKPGCFFFLLHGGHKKLSVETKICRKFADTRL